MSSKIAQNQSNYSSSHTVTLPTNSPSTITINPVGSSGNYLFNTGSTVGWQAAPTSTQFHSQLTIKPPDGKDAVISTNKSELNIDQAARFMQAMTQRYCVIPEDTHLLEQHPTLRDAYDEYKRILISLGSDDAFLVETTDELRNAYKQYETLRVILTTKENT
jgi:hypothetical protein